MKKLLLLGLCIILIVGVTAVSISKEIDLDENQKTALGVNDLMVHHNCIEGNNNCKARLYKEGIIDKEISIDTSEKICIKEGLDKTINQMVCITWRGLTQEEIDEIVRKETEDKLKSISDILIRRQNIQDDLLNNEMEIIIK